MSSALTLGPLALPLSPLSLMAAAALGHAVGTRLARRRGQDVSELLLRMLLLGLVAARVAFMWQWRSLYLPEPWTMLDLRDGGWEPVAGFGAAALYAVHRLRGQALLQWPVAAATLTTLLLWTAAQVALAVGIWREAPGLPALTLPDLQGRAVALAGFQGKPSVVNLWATWCGPCRAEMPVLQAAQQTESDVTFVFVDQGEDAARVARFLQLQGLQLRNVLLDERRAVAAVFNESALPTTLFFDARGRLVALRVGAMSAATLQQQLKALRQH